MNVSQRRERTGVSGTEDAACVEFWSLAAAALRRSSCRAGVKRVGRGVWPQGDWRTQQGLCLAGSWELLT